MGFNTGRFNHTRFNTGGGGIKALKTSITVESTTSASMALDMGIVATVDCISSVTVLLTHDLFLDQIIVIETEGAIVAALAVDTIIQSLIGGSASLTATLDTCTGLISSIDGVSTVDGQPYSLYIYATYTVPDSYIRITWEGT